MLPHPTEIKIQGSWLRINIKKEIIKIINDYKIKSILDAPCGDFNWIEKILNEVTQLGVYRVDCLSSERSKYISPYSALVPLLRFESL